jgi:hypothetical protein
MRKMVIYRTNDEMVIDLLLMYCEGKSFLWNMFFGWRETKTLSDGSQICMFKVPRNICQMAEKVAKKYGYYVVED